MNRLRHTLRHTFRRSHPHILTHSHTHPHILTPTQAEEKAQADSPPRSPETAAMLNLAKALEEGPLDKDPFLQEYRAKRLEQLKQQAKMGARR